MIEVTRSRSLIGSDEPDIRVGLRALQVCVHALAVEKGWYDPPKSVPEALMLCVSELSEALECCRTALDAEALRRIEEDDSGKPEGFAVELGDCLIRLLDLSESLRIDLVDAVLRKHAFNQTRPRRHGGKQL